MVASTWDLREWTRIFLSGWKGLLSTSLKLITGTPHPTNTLSVWGMRAGAVDRWDCRGQYKYPL